jgi:hypothetical protein
MWLGAAAAACASSGSSSNEGTTSTSSSATSQGSGSTTVSGGSRSTGGSSSGTTSGQTGSSSAQDGGTAGDCDAQPLCEGFESDTVGAAPDSTRWGLITGSTPGSPNVGPDGGGLRVAVDNSQHHTGSNSLRVIGGDSNGWYASNTSAFQKISGSQIYVRFFARFSGDPASSAQLAATQNHNGFLSMWSGPPAVAASPNFFHDYNSLDAGPEGGQLRLGFQMSIMDWNWIPPDSTLPDLSPTGVAQSVAPMANQWDCYEFHIDETNSHIEFWFDSNPVGGLSFDGPGDAGIKNNWTSSGPHALSVQSLGLGWLQLSTAETAWYDDVVVSASRFGCQ